MGITIVHGRCLRRAAIEDWKSCILNVDVCSSKNFTCCIGPDDELTEKFTCRAKSFCSDDSEIPEKFPNYIADSRKEMQQLKIKPFPNDEKKEKQVDSGNQHNIAKVVKSIFKQNQDVPKTKKEKVQSNADSEDLSSVSSASKDLIENCLELHNKARKTDGVRVELEWDEDLAKSALNWSNHLASQKSGNLDHSGPGENLYKGGDFKDCTRPMFLWVDQEKQFFSRNATIDKKNVHKYGHYTQVVWSDTRKVGCGGSRGFFTCHYSPAGNVVGKNPFK